MLTLPEILGMADPFAVCRMLGIAVLALAPTVAGAGWFDLDTATAHVAATDDATARASLRRVVDEQIAPALREPAPAVALARPARAAELVFGGIAVRHRGQSLCLTDMWRAGGADRMKRPGEWLRQEAAREFIAHLSATMGHDHSLTETKEGRGGGTWAHWQVALAYAKYLSPAFHAWCNHVVKEHMAGLTVATAPTDVAVAASTLFAEVAGLRAEVANLRQTLLACASLVVTQLGAEVSP